jgi:putative ABC transport system ATP-binding protein
VSLQHINKSFQIGAQEVTVLRDVSMEVNEGDFIILFGPSGCGKSTMLHILLGLEEPTQGQVLMEGQNFYASGIEDERSEYRKRHVGMIFQKPNWVQAMNVLDNVMFPLMLLDTDKVTAVLQANIMLDRVGMVNWAQYSPNELSSGQQQKVSLARAMITDPQIIVADEPTGNLDYDSGKDLMELMVSLNNQGKTIVMVSHDLEYLKYAKTAVQIFNGQIIGVFKGKEKDQLSEGLHLKRGVLNQSDGQDGQDLVTGQPTVKPLIMSKRV